MQMLAGKKDTCNWAKRKLNSSSSNTSASEIPVYQQDHQYDVKSIADWDKANDKQTPSRKCDSFHYIMYFTFLLLKS